MKRQACNLMIERKAAQVDRPGVLAEITGVLGKHQISIASVIQHEPSGDGAGRVVPLVIMTQQAKEGAAQAAVAELYPGDD